MSSMGEASSLDDAMTALSLPASAAHSKVLRTGDELSRDGEIEVSIHIYIYTYINKTINAHTHIYMYKSHLEEPTAQPQNPFESICIMPAGI